MSTPNAASADLIGRYFALDRDADISGISGNGRVAYALDLPGFGALLAWDTQWPTVDFRPSMAILESIHGHNGATRITPLHPDTDAEAIERARTLLREVGPQAFTTLSVALARLP